LRLQMNALGFGHASIVEAEIAEEPEGGRDDR
jgi:hypothetical protein